MRGTITSLQVLLDRQDAERASGFSAVASFSGQDVLLPHEVQVFNGYLEWKPFRNTDEVPGKDWTQQRIGDAFGVPGRTDLDCLWHFIRLADAHSEEEFARFARKHGVLYLAPHGIPGSSPPRRIDPEAPVPLSTLGTTDLVGKFRPFDLRERWHQEAIEVWRAWALHAKLVLVFGIALRDDDRIAPQSFLHRHGIDSGPDLPHVQFEEDSIYVERTDRGELQLSEYGFTLFWRLSPTRLIRDLEECDSVVTQRKCLAWYLDHQWLHFTDLTLRIEWIGSRPQIQIDRPITKRDWLSGVHWCFPVLAGQLVATILSDRRVNFCVNCGMPYPCERRRLGGRCPECRESARRATKRAWKARHAAGIIDKTLDEPPRATEESS
jgi:hypothetical protein